ncbi:MAG TPA: hypothetical protein VF173_27855 [Thermoanaerobaculia bacterium]|nr:hypothetical protein [Thermoanaerobaculia bacterium]
MESRRSASLAVALPVCLALFGLGTAPVRASIVDACPFSGVASEPITRGVIVPVYEGSNLRSMEFRYGANVTGNYRITVEVHRGSFDGPLVAAPQTAYVDLSPYNMSVATPVVFDFGGAPVVDDEMLAVRQTATGPGQVFFDGGMGASPVDPQPPAPPVEAYETTDTTPPLSTYQKARVGLTLIQDDLSGGCIPSVNTLCIDDVPGDRRFAVTMDFNHGSALHGPAFAVSTASLGVTNGGLFWFFSQHNPEMLVKVLNACSLNHRFWVFFTAGTNVGFTVNVRDTTTGQVKTYSNADNNTAAPVEDTDAFVCP